MPGNADPTPGSGPISRPLIEAIERRYGIHIRSAQPLSGGYECDVVRADTDAGDRYVLRISPPSRTIDELSWAYDLAAFASARIPKAIAPLAAADGSRVFIHDGRPVALFPYVPAPMMRRGDTAATDEAARLLGRLHHELAAWPDARPRPAPPEPRPLSPQLADDDELARHAAVFPDAELDAFLKSWRANPRLAAAPIHGDYYSGNLLVADGRVAAVIDWDDAVIGSREYELAWAVWEFAQSPAPATLDRDRAARFIAAYAETGPVDVSDASFVIPLIRAHLRFEAARAATERAQGWPVDEDYIARGAAAFHALRGFIL